MAEKLDDIELERKLKKEQKAKEKEAKKLKALQKPKFPASSNSSDGPKKEKKGKKGETEDENPEFIDPETPAGEKKRLSTQMAMKYNPSAVEKSWYQWWEKSEFFVADAKSTKPPFVIVLPPPNVTGALHIGHALTASIQDLLIRWARMSGYNALWVPGMDHAGIATQVVVEKKLMRENKLTRHDIGREKFVSEVWKWKEQYGGTILTQERRLGASLDWSRECFTMDEKRSNAVTEAFVRLHEQGLIYRANRMVNWDCTLRTAISDIEVDYKDIKQETWLKVPGYSSPVQFGVLIYFAYPLENDSGEVVVATTRIETMLSDVAIAINSTDKRYMHLHGGKFAVHPFNGRRIPIIIDDELVDPEFGTGAVKISTGHDVNDFELGKRHTLDCLSIFTDDGKMVGDKCTGEFAGMPRYEARVKVVEELKKKGLYRDCKNNEMVLGICSRSGDVVEPRIRPQWFVNCNDMANAALEAVKSKRLEIIPQQYEADWFRWLGNIRDWCISRQLWWGHRIPAWYVTLEEDSTDTLGKYDDHWIVARTESDALSRSRTRFPGKKLRITQDPDVLDTWFSAGLFPLSVLGWPDETEDLGRFYPTSVLETGHDILFFWVARMVMLGIQLRGDIPFRKVYLHPMIRDAHGRKMSKSLGNVVDPLEVITGISLPDLHKRLEEGNLDPSEVKVAKEGQKKDFPEGIKECGADALRFSLIAYTAQSDRINLDIQRVFGYRTWCNKLWNATRFALQKLGSNYTPPPRPASISVRHYPPICKWILSSLNKAVSKTVSSMESFKFSDATSAVYYFWISQLCDVFIEAIKPYFWNEGEQFEKEREASRNTLWICLDAGLRLLHPFMPFLSEELYQRLPAGGVERRESIMISDYPTVVEEWTHEQIETEMETVNKAVTKLRSLKPSEKAKLPSFALCKADQSADIIASYADIITTLVPVSSIKILRDGDSAPAGCAIEVVSDSLSVYLQLQGALNPEAEKEKLKKRREETQKLKASLEQSMGVSAYKEKAPQSKQEEDMKKLNSLMDELKLIGEAETELEKAINGQK
ncbi:hypothetical protein LUZ60_001703 [Juncus effusus]|nr:hypothetical protein LUZ60_001703 [Juncus effusus]